MFITLYQCYHRVVYKENSRQNIMLSLLTKYFLQLRMARKSRIHSRLFVAVCHSGGRAFALRLDKHVNSSHSDFGGGFLNAPDGGGGQFVSVTSLGKCACKRVLSQGRVCEDSYILRYLKPS